MATVMTGQDREDILARRAALKGAAVPVEPITDTGEEYGSFLGTLGSSVEAGWDAYVAAAAPKEHSGYASRKLGKSLEELKKHETKADVFTQVASGVARYAPAIGVSMLPVPGARVAGATVGSQIAAADALLEQAREGKPLDMGSAQGAGAVTAALDLATGGAARLAKGPVKRFVAERTGEAVSGAGGQAAINVAADKDISEGLGEAALFSAAAGTGLDLGGRALKRLSPWGEDAVKDGTAAGDQVGRVLPEDFKNSAIDQEDKIFNLTERLKDSKTRGEAEGTASEIVDEGVVGGAPAAILSAIRKFEGGELVPHAFDVDVAEGLSGSGPTRNLAEMFGISKEDIKKSGDATLDARSRLIGKDIEGDNTRATDEAAFKKFYDGRMTDINNVFKDNADFAANLKKKYEREDRSAAEYEAVEDLGIALRKLRDGAKSGSEDLISENAQKALARATELGVLKDLKGFSGKAGEFDPVNDVRSRRIFDQIAHRRLPGVSNITPDPRAKGTGQAGPEPIDAVPLGRTGKTLMSLVRPKASQKKLKAMKEKSKELTQSLTGGPKKPSKKPVDESVVEDVPEVDAELEAARAKAEAAVQEELKKRRAESSWKMAGQPKARQKAPSDEELMPVEEAKEIFDEVIKKAGVTLPTGAPKQRKVEPEPAPSDEPQVRTRLNTDTTARKTLAEQAGLAQERQSLHDMLKRDRGVSDEEARAFLDTAGDIRTNAQESGYGKNVEKYVKDQFDAVKAAKKEEGGSKVRTLEDRLEEQRILREDRHKAADERAAKLRSEATARQEAAAKTKQDAADFEDSKAKDYVHNAKSDIDFEEIGMGPRLKEFMNTPNRTIAHATKLVRDAETLIEKASKGDRQALDKWLKKGSTADQVTAEAHFKEQFAKVKQAREKRNAELKELEAEVAEQNRVLKERQDEASKAGEESRIADDELDAAKEAPESSTKEIEEVIGALPPEALPGAAEVALERLAVTGDEAVVDAVIKEMKKEGMDKEAAVIKKYKTILKRVAERRGVMKSTGGVDENYLISQDEYKELRKEYSGTEFGSNVGSMGKDLSASIFGWSDKLAKTGLPRADILKEFIDNRRKMKKEGRTVTKAPSGKFKRRLIAPGKK